MVGAKENKNAEKCYDCHKDFCSCYKDLRKKDKEIKINKSLLFLSNNGIDYTESNTPNVVKLKKGLTVALLSLKHNNGFFKLRYEGSNKWYFFSKDKLIKKFKI